MGAWKYPGSPWYFILVRHRGFELASGVPLPDEYRSLGFPPHHSPCRSPSDQGGRVHGWTSAAEAMDGRERRERELALAPIPDEKRSLGCLVPDRNYLPSDARHASARSRAANADGVIAE